ncbi:Fpg/Nei family DNA glycosylase [Frigoribacterium sp. VKM Ac-1396]|uniref:Fpg/Nei family DNA glycosylase n=1 Tax=Frigoribacterium sp. VKM Ac-1396 TaxID=2783821 RepID=UPI00188AD44E|nr:Fpg/Nei family DNA glycosylase [Frigoribacterium sp. VKM Ac-1396]
MPEGHSVHRIANQFEQSFVGHRAEVTSPQGRFAAGAEKLDGATMVDAKAVGKQMFLEFDNGLWLHVHLGLYGAWDFAGAIATGHSMAESRTRRSATRKAEAAPDADGEHSMSSIGAPRTSRVRMAEQEKTEDDVESFPPEPVGQVRVRLLTDTAVGDLRGPTKCEVLDAAGVDLAISKLGPDPLVDSPKKGADRFVSIAGKKRTPIGLLLMDQSVVSGIGNIYRAELLFRARLDPHTPGNQVPEDVLRDLYKDWTKLLKSGVELGQMMTMDGLTKAQRAKALRSRADRHWVYHREGLPCRVCGTNIVMEMAAGRKLYWCPTDQT